MSVPFEALQIPRSVESPIMSLLHFGMRPRVLVLFAMGLFSGGLYSGGQAVLGQVSQSAGRSPESSPESAPEKSQVKGPRPMQIEDLFRYERYAEPQLSPDGKTVVYQTTRITDALKNTKSTNLHRFSLEDGTSSPVTASSKSDTHARFSPDGKRLLFESTRGGSPQLYVLDSSVLGEARQLTSISTGASTGIWSPDGKQIAFVSTIRPEFSELPFAQSDAKNQEADEKAASSLVKAKVFTRLFYRHWDSYVEDKRQHIFVIQADGTECRDVTPGDRDAYPTSMTFSAGDDFRFTPDGRYLIITAVPAQGESWTTNYDLCRIDLSNPKSNWETLTTNNAAADCNPKFSPSGTQMAYKAQARPGYEADKWNLMVVDCKPDGTWTGEPKSWTAEIDRSVGEFSWTSDQSIAFVAEQDGATAMFQADGKSKPTQVGLQFGDALGGPNRAGQINAMHTAADRVVLARATMNGPAELYVAKKSELGAAPLRKITQGNDTLSASLQRTAPESIQVTVEGDRAMQMWILKPPGFDPSKKWPVAYLIHGGPQGAWEDGWSFRWTPQLWAAQGYVVVLPNPRGSTGFGQKFCDEISGDWGGKCYRDLVAGLKAIQQLPYVDADRIGSAGASFGGYMQDWFAVNEISKDLQCLISHCSVYNFESMWGTTDELWFDEFEHGGLPWELPGKYREYSPHTRAENMGRFKTPMLVIHNDLDFRCPIGQGHELFQALQRQGVPSRFINFPDEGHWVAKSANSILWHNEVFVWLKKYCPPGGR
jgi:dipeptidyl aminopeptidase/acylaminoacyl peptidase